MTEAASAPDGDASPAAPRSNDAAPDAASPRDSAAAQGAAGAPEHHSILGDIHASTLAMRRRISSAHAFRDRNILGLVVVGVAVLVVLTLLPFVRISLAGVTERLLTIGALVFLISAPGYWLGLGHRSLAISGAIVLVLYGSTSWVSTGGRVDDLFFVARIAAFLIFALAGFNLVFVLEEMIYDAHRYLPHRKRAWLALPLALDAALCLFLPWWWNHGGLELPTFWIAAMITTAILASWWFIRLVNQIDLRQIVIRELHLFVAGILAAALLADGVRYLLDAEELISSFLALAILLGTWLYVSYTTLQRTHLLLRGRNALPWAAILLAAAYAIFAHGQGMYLATGTIAVQDLTLQRMEFMIIGIWIGVAFYAARGLWRTLRLVLQLRTITPRGRHVAQKAARMAQGVLTTEHLVEQATRGLYLGLDRALPGHARGRPPMEPPRDGWELDGDGRVVVVADGDAAPDDASVAQDAQAEASDAPKTEDSSATQGKAQDAGASKATRPPEEPPGT